MTGPNQGFAESLARFRAEVATAVTRARRASAEARDQSAAFRRETKELAQQARDAKAGQQTDAAARERAAEWRRSQGLPVDEPPRRPLPEEPVLALTPDEDEELRVQVLDEVEEPARPAPEPVAAEGEPDAEAERAPRPRRSTADPTNDDDDFSQHQILFHGG